MSSVLLPACRVRLCHLFRKWIETGIILLGAVFISLALSFSVSLLHTSVALHNSFCILMDSLRWVAVVAVIVVLFIRPLAHTFVVCVSMFHRMRCCLRFTTHTHTGRFSFRFGYFCFALEPLLSVSQWLRLRT